MRRATKAALQKTAEIIAAAPVKAALTALAVSFLGSEYAGLTDIIHAVLTVLAG